MKLLSRGSLLSRPSPSRRRLPPSSLEPLSLAFGMLLVLSLMFLMLLALRILSLPIPCKSPSDNANVSLESFAVETGVEKKEREQPWVEILSWKPRIIRYHGFLTDEECNHLIMLAKPHMQRSTIGGKDHASGKVSRIRTSSGMFLQRGQDEIIRAIEKRISDFTFIPVNHGEALQVLHYEVGQKYDTHADFFLTESNKRNGGQRMATLLMYLSDVEEGGETVFPMVKVNESSSSHHNHLSECAKQGLSVRPKMGDALLFFSLEVDGKMDGSSMHGGCPVIRGEKWVSTKWMRVGEFVV